MFKSTLFIAVQCCQCSTMQVKQQKKSSNRWTCVVCNQKQSVRKVYSQAYQAKDIRQFVQSFNISRKLSDEQAALHHDQDPSRGHFVEQLEGSQEKEDKKVKRRTDWNEYMEDEEDKNPDYLKSKSKEEGMFEPEIVTEFPDEGMFKKPKLKGKYDSSSSSSGLGDNKLYKPQFSRRNTNKATCNQPVATKEHTKTQPRFSREGPVCAEYAAKNNNLPRNIVRGLHSQQEQQKKKHITTVKKGASKWCAYIEEDEGDHFEGERAAFADDLKLMCHYDLQTDVTDQRVEDDIHPDFI